MQGRPNKGCSMKKLNRVTGVLAWGVLAMAVGGAWAQPGTKPAKPSEPLPAPGPTAPAKPINPPGKPSNPSPSTPSPSTPSPTAPSPAPAPAPVVPDQVGKGALVDLRPKFKAGQTFKLKMGNTSTSTIHMPGGLDVLDDPKPAGPGNQPAKEEDASQSKTTQEFVLVFKTTGVSEDGTATVDVTFDSIKMKIESEWLTDEFDSTKPARPAKAPSSDPLQQLGGTPMLEQSLRPLVGDKLTLTVDRNGNVTKVDGGEKFAALFGGLGGSAGGTPGTPGGGAAKNLFGSIFTLDKTRPQARVGDRWTTRDTMELAMTGGLTMSTTYTLRDAKGGRATLGVNGRMESSSAAPTPDVPFRIKSCTHDGQCVWNTEDGFIETLDSAQKLETEINLGGKAGRSSSEQKTTVTRMR